MTMAKRKKKSKKSKHNKEQKEPEAVEVVEPETPEGPSITVQELNTMSSVMMSGGLAIDRLDPEQARGMLMQESWELCQLLIKQSIRACRQGVNDQLVQFFTQFPEALEPVRTQFNPETNEEE
jgi:hypothetical protein